jgi:hypothetical protein
MALQPISLGSMCATCFRLTGEPHRMEVYLSGYFCPTCKTFLPSRRERGRLGLASHLRVGGFALLTITSAIYSTFGMQSELVWMGFLAGFSFYFLTILQNTKEILIHG